MLIHAPIWAIIIPDEKWKHETEDGDTLTLLFQKGKPYYDLSVTNKEGVIIFRRNIESNHHDFAMRKAYLEFSASKR